jgi:ABC-type transporter MlaC component
VLHALPSLKSAAVLFACSVLACFSSSISAEDATALSFVDRLNAELQRAAHWNSDQGAKARAVCEHISRSLLDLTTMMETASSGVIASMDRAQRATYKSAFIARVVRDCSANVKDYLGHNVELAGVRPLKSGAKIIATRSQSDVAPSRLVMWQVQAQTPGEPVVQDIFIDGRSAMLTLREEAANDLSRDPANFDALILTLMR